MIKDAKQVQGKPDSLVVDLHPDRPTYRGIALPNSSGHIISLEADPTFEEMSNAGAVVDKWSESHTVLDDMFLISGEIPRVTHYETGLKNAVRFDPEENDWFSDELIADERFLTCNLKGEHDTLCQYGAFLTSPRERTRRLHRLQPRRRSQHCKARVQARWRPDTSARCSRRLPSGHERRVPDPEHGSRSETA